MNIKPSIVKTGSIFKTAVSKTKDGVLVVTDTVEFAGEWTVDLVGGVSDRTKEGFVAHRRAHGDRMLARFIRREERKTERVAKRAEKKENTTTES